MAARAPAALGWAGAACELRSCTNTAGLRCTRSCWRRSGAARRRATDGPRTSPRTHSTAAQATEVGARRPSRPLDPVPGRACRAAARGAGGHRLRAAEVPALPLPRAGLGHRLGGPTYPALAGAQASTVPLPPRAAAFGRLRDSSRLHALPDFKNKQQPSPPRGVRWASAGQRLPKLGSLLLGPRRDARAVTPTRSRRRNRAPRARTVCLGSALPPFVSPQSCDAVSGLHGSDSSVELTA